MIDPCPFVQLEYKMSLNLRQTQDQPTRHNAIHDLGLQAAVIILKLRIEN